jgi:hypothetical protein
MISKSGECLRAGHHPSRNRCDAAQTNSLNRQMIPWKQVLMQSVRAGSFDIA